MTTGLNVVEGDCREIMRLLIDEGVQVQSIATDPPYGLNFMGRYWDTAHNLVFQKEVWELCLKLLPPGGFLAAFGGTRTYHRLCCAIEDAGFEVRDQLAWVYGTGFPKSVDISKAIDKAAGAEREVVGYDASRARPNRKYRSGAIGNLGGHEHISDRSDNGATLTAPATPEARQWDGWGTALKPAWEPILVCSRPISIEQHLAIALYELSLRVLLWLNLHAGVAERLFTDILAKLKKVASSVLDGAKIRSLASIGIAPSAVLGFTLNSLACADRIKTKDCFALSHVKLSGKRDRTSETEILSGKVGDISTRVMDMFMSGTMGDTSENTALLWRSILDEILIQGSTYTTSTVIRLTTVLRTLSLLVFQNISEDIGGLFPEQEPIVLARRPLSGTIVKNVLAHGTGGLNIDACRIPINEDIDDPRLGGKGSWSTASMAQSAYGEFEGTTVGSSPKGRFPANLVHDASDEVLEAFAAYGNRGGGDRRGDCKGRRPAGFGDVGHAKGDAEPNSSVYADSGSAARFFYGAKANKAERMGSSHPTIKPIKLMQWLVRLITPPGGIVLDPFAGTGTTGQAAKLEGFDYLLIEQDPEYIRDIERRLAG
jgi:hypothetical protein